MCWHVMEWKDESAVITAATHLCSTHLSTQFSQRPTYKQHVDINHFRHALHISTQKTMLPRFIQPSTTRESAGVPSQLQPMGPVSFKSLYLQESASHQKRNATCFVPENSGIQHWRTTLLRLEPRSMPSWPVFTTTSQPPCNQAHSLFSFPSPVSSNH